MIIFVKQYPVHKPGFHLAGFGLARDGLLIGIPAANLGIPALAPWTTSQTINIRCGLCPHWWIPGKCHDEVCSKVHRTTCHDMQGATQMSQHSLVLSHFCSFPKGSGPLQKETSASLQDPFLQRDTHCDDRILWVWRQMQILKLLRPLLKEYYC